MSRIKEEVMAMKKKKKGDKKHNSSRGLLGCDPA
jgi:hypothetical protein